MTLCNLPAGGTHTAYTSRMPNGPIHLGTSSFTATGWEGSFYPRGLKSSDYLAYYAEHFDSVEVDSTYYACPTAKTVVNWFAKTPDNFIFSVKVPQTITHDKVLVDCDTEWKEFLDTMGLLQHKLGPVVFQFPHFNRAVFRDREPFMQRLVAFLKRLPKDHKFAVELRNKDWLDGDLAYVLARFRVAVVLQDRSWMADPLTLKFDPITSDFTYVRWLGNRKEIEAMVERWDKVVVDRDEELRQWVDLFFKTTKRGITVYAYANNHYQGHGPATIRRVAEFWRERGLPDIAKQFAPKPSRDVQRRLFE
jgi:uncharacterized protein YecE (DUF72 family)